MENTTTSEKPRTMSSDDIQSFCKAIGQIYAQNEQLLSAIHSQTSAVSRLSDKLENLVDIVSQQLQTKQISPFHKSEQQRDRDRDKDKDVVVKAVDESTPSARTCFTPSLVSSFTSLGYRPSPFTMETSDPLWLNVSGTMMKVQRSLMDTDLAKDSALNAMFHSRNQSLLRKDEKDSVVIKRDPQAFHLLLSFLQDPYSPPQDPVQMDMLAAEADYWQIPLDPRDYSPCYCLNIKQELSIFKGQSWSFVTTVPSSTKKLFLHQGILYSVGETVQYWTGKTWRQCSHRLPPAVTDRKPNAAFIFNGSIYLVYLGMKINCALIYENTADGWICTRHPCSAFHANLSAFPLSQGVYLFDGFDHQLLYFDGLVMSKVTSEGSKPIVDVASNGKEIYGIAGRSVVRFDQGCIVEVIRQYGPSSALPCRLFCLRQTLVLVSMVYRECDTCVRLLIDVSTDEIRAKIEGWSSDIPFFGYKNKLYILRTDTSETLMFDGVGLTSTVCANVTPTTIFSAF